MESNRCIKKIARLAEQLTGAPKILPNIPSRYGCLGVFIVTRHPQEVVVVGLLVRVALYEFCSALLDFEVPAKPTLISTKAVLMENFCEAEIETEPSVQLGDAIYYFVSVI